MTATDRHRERATKIVRVIDTTAAVGIGGYRVDLGSVPLRWFPDRNQADVFAGELRGPIAAALADAEMGLAETARKDERLEFRAKCDPEANGRTAQHGDYRWSPWFTLDDGRVLTIHMGREGRDAMVRMFAEEATDDVLDAARTGREFPFSSSEAKPRPLVADAEPGGREAREDEREVIAKALHEECIAYTTKYGRGVPTVFDIRPWVEITEEHREHHRGHADHVVRALSSAPQAVGLAAIDVNDLADFLVESSDGTLSHAMADDVARDLKARFGPASAPVEARPVVVSAVEGERELCDAAVAWWAAECALGEAIDDDDVRFELKADLMDAHAAMEDAAQKLATLRARPSPAAGGPAETPRA